MRTTVFLDDGLIEEAKAITGLAKTSQVIDTALRDFIRRENQIRIASLCGTYKGSDIESPKRRRM